MPSPWRFTWPWLFWLTWGVVLAITDMRSEAVQTTVLLLLLGSALLGFARPGMWWFWSLLLAAWIPAEPIVNDMLRLGLAPHSNAAAWLLPPIVTLLGGLVGRLIARAMRERDPARA